MPREKSYTPFQTCWKQQNSNKQLGKCGKCYKTEAGTGCCHTDIHTHKCIYVQMNYIGSESCFICEFESKAMGFHLSYFQPVTVLHTAANVSRITCEEHLFKYKVKQLILHGVMQMTSLPGKIS